MNKTVDVQSWELDADSQVKRPTSIYSAIVDSFFINRFIWKHRRFHLFLSLLGIGAFTARTIAFILEIISNPNSPNLSISSFILYAISQVWVLYAVLENFAFPSVKFIKSFDEIWSELPLSSEPEIVTAIKKSNRFSNIVSFCILINSITILIASSTIEYLSTLNASIIYFLGNKSVELYANLIIANILRGFLISGGYIKIGHQYIYNEIVAIAGDATAPDLSFCRLRHEHHDLVQCGHLCDAAFRRFVTTVCSVQVPMAVLIIYNNLYMDIDVITRVNYFLALLDFGTFIAFFVPCLVGFYSFPSQARDYIYFSTLVGRSNLFKSEALHFIDMINLKSCGIKFMGLYLLTPDIIPTFATIVFTYVMAIPNFRNAV
ncbi:uncharacterized protein LOC107364693 [Tetranychus urticae]|uniref:Uncharacterized protein n=1 Tax=Tetranychus urticae TaxID=32264 RepID=T1KKP0_TETUR|nr:uncharacterized protein LOC107364693 [Tetranychus urticae]